MLMQILFLFRAWYSVSNSIKVIFIFINLIFIVFMALIPILDIQKNVNDLLNKTLCFLHYLFFLAYLFFWLHDKKEFESNLASFGMNFGFDLVVVIMIYVSYSSNYLTLIAFVILLHIVVRLLQITGSFYYKLSLFFISIIAISLLILFSSFFVKVAGLANYQTDLTINKKDIPKYIKNLKIPKCNDIEIKKDEIVFQKYTCIIDEDEDKVAFQDILVKVKTDGRYWLELILENSDDTRKDFWIP